FEFLVTRVGADPVSREFMILRNLVDRGPDRIGTHALSFFLRLWAQCSDGTVRLLLTLSMLIEAGDNFLDGGATLDRSYFLFVPRYQFVAVVIILPHPKRAEHHAHRNELSAPSHTFGYAFMLVLIPIFKA